MPNGQLNWITATSYNFGRTEHKSPCLTVQPLSCFSVFKRCRGNRCPAMDYSESVLASRWLAMNYSDFQATYHNIIGKNYNNSVRNIRAQLVAYCSIVTCSATPKRRWNCTELHGVTSQKKIVAVAITPNQQETYFLIYFQLYFL
jgi:hypothetical protein